MKIAIIGQGGHSKVIQDLIASNGENRIVAYLDDKYEGLNRSKSFYFGPILAAQKMIKTFNDTKFVIAIGDNKIRKLIVQKLNLDAENYITLIHKSAVVSPNAVIGSGTVIMAHSVIQADSVIGAHSIINTGAVIEHDNTIGDFTHVSPNATLTGSVKIDEGVHIGAGATIIPNIKIGAWSVIGAGATVLNHIPSQCTAVGVPARAVVKEGV
jgi:acetyltransferase EpsM